MATQYLHSKFYLASNEEKLVIPHPFNAATGARNYAQEHDLIQRGYTGWRGSDVIRMLNKGIIKESSEEFAESKYTLSELADIAKIFYDTSSAKGATVFAGLRPLFYGRWEDLSQAQRDDAIEGLRTRIEREGLLGYLERKRPAAGQELTNSIIAQLRAKGYLPSLGSVPQVAPKYEFFPEEVKKRLPPLGETEGQKDPIVQVKFFTPWSNWTWYGIEFDGENEFYGWVVGQEKEFGYFSLSELQSVRGPMDLKIERDIYFVPKPLSHVMEEYGELLPMTVPKGHKVTIPDQVPQIIRSTLPEPLAREVRKELRKLPTWKLQEAYAKLQKGEPTGTDIIEQNRSHALTAVSEILWERGKLHKK